MTAKTKRILVWVATGLVIAGAIVALIADVAKTPESAILVPDSTTVIVDTMPSQVLDAIVSDTVISDSTVVE